MSNSINSRIGDYERLELIGSGTQGRVYKARCLSQQNPEVALGTVVALKILRSVSHDAKADERFDRQTRILRRLSHPNIVTYVDSFTWQQGEWDEAKALAMEYLEGESLDVTINRHPQGLPLECVQDIFNQCLQGLAYAQEQGVTHRDLKPSNIYVTREGTVKLIDFGIARGEDSGQTTTGFKGSFDYMAPDFLALQDFHGDEISDVFSIAVCFYEALTGRLPYRPLEEAAHIGYVKRWQEDREDEPGFEPGVFRVISNARAFVTKSLAKDRQDRFQHFHEMLQALKPLRPLRIRQEGKDKHGYELIRVLGQGGFGEVFEGRRITDGRRVAIKHLHAIAHSDRFIREARLLQRYKHPHLVEYIDFLEIENVLEEKKLYLVMEYLEGMPHWTLTHRVRQSPQGMDVMEVLELFQHYLEALQFLHEHPKTTIHRDIKPGNLYAPAGRPENGKIFDLGVALDVTGTASSKGFVPGTFEFMAPEFATSDKARGSAQSDLYSLGLSLYEALTGRPAYPRLPIQQQQALMEFLARAERETSIRYDALSFKRWPALSKIVAMSLEKDPNDRYERASQMREELEVVLQEIRDESDAAFDGTDPITSETMFHEFPPPPLDEDVELVVTAESPTPQTTIPVVQQPPPTPPQWKRFVAAARVALKKPLFIAARAAVVTILVSAIAFYAIRTTPTWLVGRMADIEIKAFEQEVHSQAEPRTDSEYPEALTDLRQRGRLGMMRFSKHAERWQSGLDEIDDFAAQLPAAFDDAYAEAIATGNANQTTVLLAEWVKSSAYTKLMNITIEDHTARADRMQGGLECIHFEDAVKNLRRSTPTSLTAYINALTDLRQSGQSGKMKFQKYANCWQSGLEEIDGFAAELPAAFDDALAKTKATGAVAQTESLLAEWEKLSAYTALMQITIEQHAARTERMRDSLGHIRFKDAVEDVRKSMPAALTAENLVQAEQTAFWYTQALHRPWAIPAEEKKQLLDQVRADLIELVTTYIEGLSTTIEEQYRAGTDAEHEYLGLLALNDRTPTLVRLIPTVYETTQESVRKAKADYGFWQDLGALRALISEIRSPNSVVSLLEKYKDLQARADDEEKNQGMEQQRRDATSRIQGLSYRYADQAARAYQALNPFEGEQHETALQDLKAKVPSFFGGDALETALTRVQSEKARCLKRIDIEHGHGMELADVKTALTELEHKAAGSAPDEWSKAFFELFKLRQRYDERIFGDEEVSRLWTEVRDAYASALEGFIREPDPLSTRASRLEQAAMIVQQEATRNILSRKAENLLQDIRKQEDSFILRMINLADQDLTATISGLKEPLHIRAGDKLETPIPASNVTRTIHVTFKGKKGYEPREQKVLISQGGGKEIAVHQLEVALAALWINIAQPESDREPPIRVFLSSTDQDNWMPFKNGARVYPGPHNLLFTRQDYKPIQESIEVELAVGRFSRPGPSVQDWAPEEPLAGLLAAEMAWKENMRPIEDVSELVGKINAGALDWPDHKRRVELLQDIVLERQESINLLGSIGDEFDNATTQEIVSKWNELFTRLAGLSYLVPESGELRTLWDEIVIKLTEAMQEYMDTIDPLDARSERLSLVLDALGDQEATTLLGQQAHARMLREVRHRRGNFLLRVVNQSGQTITLSNDLTDEKIGLKAQGVEDLLLPLKSLEPQQIGIRITGAAGYKPREFTLTMLPGGGMKRRVPKLEILLAQIVFIETELPENDPPVAVEIRMRGEKSWVSLPSDFKLAPAPYELRFRRKDYEPVVRSVHPKRGQERLKVQMPTADAWEPTDALKRLRDVEKASRKGDAEGVDRLLAMRPEPLFEWDPHARAWNEIRLQRYQATRLYYEKAAQKDELEIADYRSYLYQVEDPEFGTYRLLTGGPISPSISLSPIPQTTPLSSDEYASRWPRLKAWQEESAALGKMGGRQQFASALAKLARGLSEQGREELAQQCAFEGALLGTEPADLPQAYLKATRPLEVYRWRAHALFQPLYPSRDALRDLEYCASHQSPLNEFDFRLALFAAYYSWANTIEGEGKFAKEIERLLDTIIQRIPANDVIRIIRYLADSNAALDLDEQAYPSLYIIVALSNMPSNSPLQAAAHVWLQTHGKSDSSVKKKLSAMKDQLGLLERLLASVELDHGSPQKERRVAGAFE